MIHAEIVTFSFGKLIKSEYVHTVVKGQIGQILISGTNSSGRCNKMRLILLII